LARPARLELTTFRSAT